MLNGDVDERRGNLFDFIDKIIGRIKGYEMFPFSVVGKASADVQKCKKKQLHGHYGFTQVCHILIVLCSHVSLLSKVCSSAELCGRGAHPEKKLT